MHHRWPTLWLRIISCRLGSTVKMKSRNHRTIRSPFGSSGIPRNRKQPELSIGERDSPRSLERFRHGLLRRARSSYKMLCIEAGLRCEYSESVECSFPGKNQRDLGFSVGSLSPPPRSLERRTTITFRKRRPGSQHYHSRNASKLPR